MVKFVFGGDMPRDARITIGLPAISMSGVIGNQPADPLFQCPDNFILVPAGVELGPNLFVEPEPPILQLTISDQQVILSWPSWASNYVPEVSGALGAGAPWTTLNNATGIADGLILQTNRVDSGAGFYRLRGL